MEYFKWFRLLESMGNLNPILRMGHLFGKPLKPLSVISHLPSQFPQCITIRPLYDVTIINGLGVILVDMRIVVRNAVTVEPPCIE